MNEVEMLSAKVSALAHRVGLVERRLVALESSPRNVSQIPRLEIEAHELARKMGVPAEVLWQARSRRERRRLALELRKQGATVREIACLFGCTERTVGRWQA